MNDSQEFSFESKRIFARPWRLEDAEAALKIYSNPKVTFHMPKARAETLLEMHTRIEKIIARDSEWPWGIGSNAVFSKATGELIGNLLLKPLPDNDGNSTDDIEIGWHLASEYWGKGLATEGARALMNIGFDQLGLNTIYAVVKTANRQSVNVTQRLGMRHLGLTDQYYNETIELFSIEKSTWQQQENAAPDAGPDQEPA